MIRIRFGDNLGNLDFEGRESSFGDAYLLDCMKFIVKSLFISIYTDPKIDFLRMSVCIGLEFQYVHKIHRRLQDTSVKSHGYVGAQALL